MNKLMLGAGIVIAVVAVFFLSGVLLPTDAARTTQLLIFFVGPLVILLAAAGYSFMLWKSHRASKAVALSSLAVSVALLVLYVLFLGAGLRA